MIHGDETDREPFCTQRLSPRGRRCERRCNDMTDPRERLGSAKSKFKKMIMKFICNPFFLIDLVVFEVFALIMCLFMFKL